MFSQLGPLFKATFRQAESTDTRQGIKHYERDDPRKKRHRAEKEETSELWEDSTSVSIEALRAFLINFLKTIPPEDGNEPTENKDKVDVPEGKTQEYREPKTTATARAVHAYQSMNDKTHTGSQKPLPSVKNMPSGESGVSLLHASDVRVIHMLIDDLKNLSDRGVETLTIQKADSFLESLVNAVNLLKSRL